MPEELNAHQFLAHLEEAVHNHRGAFIANMQMINMKPMTFREWIQIYIRWMEWEAEEGNEHYES